MFLLFSHCLDATYNGYNYIAVDEPLTQADASGNCAALGGTLASIWTDDENEFIKALTTKADYCGPSV